MTGGNALGDERVAELDRSRVPFPKSVDHAAFRGNGKRSSIDKCTAGEGLWFTLSGGC